MADRPHQRQPSASQRSIQGEESWTVGNSNAFGDDFYLESFGIADGYQPSSQPQNISRPRTPSRRSPLLQPSTSPSPDVQKRKSQLKGNSQGLGPRNSFSLRHDAQNSDPPRRTTSIASTSAYTEATTARPYSTVSRLSIPRPPSTYAGASAPSHPYGMYPQTMTSLNRQSTTSTVRPAADRTSIPAGGPTHPYGMYQQNTVLNDESDTLEPSGDIASVGFPGLRQQQYARRLGPDGEEADDILGPDGHTEQLPPYTRYPSAGPLPTKGRYAPVLEPIAPSSPVLPQTANSASSMSDALLVSPAPNEHSPNEATNHESNQNQSTKERWTDKSKQRTCFGRLPRWAVALMIFLLVVVAATLGGLVGRVLHPPHGPGMPPPMPNGTEEGETDPSATIPVYTSTVYDAAPLSFTPTGLPSIPTGQFSLMLAQPRESSETCISSLQWAAWGCAGTYGGASVAFEVENPLYSAAQVTITDSPSNQQLYYGGQPPNISMTVVAPLVNDTMDPELGPALFFFSDYDKVVLVRYNDLNATAPSKRSPEPSSQQWAELEERDKGRISPGDPLWVCYWNTTTLEGFVYVNKSATANTNETAYVSSLTSTPSPTNPPGKDMDHKDKDKGKTKRHEHSNHGMSRNHNNGMPPAQIYPRIVKLQERRDPMKIAGHPPYCVSMQMNENCQLGPPTSVPPAMLNLTEFDETDHRAVFIGKREDIAPRDSGTCACEWLT